ncbi:MAG TPA: prolipoprotein diacylglyceryl transferase, partial [Dehalococcoidia bacterium]|nr:prolipoprotein diacylglyceryl transferase [Dehalococcoidia bacterium]
MIEIAFDPILIQVGSFQLSWHGVFSALAVALAVWFGQRRMRIAGLPPESFGRITVWAILGGVIGARLFHIFDHLPYYLENPLQAFSFWEGGLAVYGAFAGGILGAILAVRREGLRVWPLLDAGAPAMLVGQAVGRLGCLTNGDAWGMPTGGP